jgi:ring-1,2-phenylacetyl-CoA epoxidase subunit PaaD
VSAVPAIVERVARAALETVPDPEIPTCSILDLGMLHAIEVDEDTLRVSLLPTFAGCPALDVIRSDTVAALKRALPAMKIEVRFTFEIPWTSDRITDEGRERMGALGIAPPGAHALPIVLEGPRAAAGPCPYCSSAETELSSAFGPTPCRAVAYCNACRNPFEPFKRKV